MDVQHNPARARLLALAALEVITIGVVSLLSPYFLQASTVPYLLQYIPVIGLLGLGQTLVILAGGPGIDLSIGAILSLAGVLIGALVGLGMDPWLASLAGLLFGTVLGLANGLLITALRIPSLMATLATLFVYGGLAVALTGGKPVTGFPQDFGWLGQGNIGGFPYQLLLLFLPAAVLLHVLLTQTPFGTHIRAAGSDEQAAALLGVRIGFVRTVLYGLNGTLAALGAVIMNSWFLMARPDAGKGMELLSVTVAVLGGTHIFGGEGSIPGTVMAVLVVTTLQIGLQLANVSPAWQLGIIGGLLIVSVAANFLFRQRWLRLV